VTFTGEDEAALRGLLTCLREFAANPAMRAAVIVATEDDGTIIGA
jgi:hypothetical protein